MRIFKLTHGRHLILFVQNHPPTWDWACLELTSLSLSLQTHQGSELTRDGLKRKYKSENNDIKTYTKVTKPTIQTNSIVLFHSFQGIYTPFKEDIGSAKGPTTFVIVDGYLAHAAELLKQSLSCPTVNRKWHFAGCDSIQ